MGVTGSAAWGDYDNDDDLDLILSGIPETGQPATRIYENKGENGFLMLQDTGIIGITEDGFVDWMDYNNDGDLDIFLGTNGKIVLYDNAGNDTFFRNEDIDIPYSGRYCDFAFGDYDDDADIDLIVSSLGRPNTSIYSNQGGQFIKNDNVVLGGVSQGSVDWGDYDNDMDLDLLITGVNEFSHNTTTIYRNDGGDIFTDINAYLRGIPMGKAIWGDVDGDGDLDILLAGEGSYWITEVYKNQGDDRFLKMDFDFNDGSINSSSFGDYDNDGDLDILYSSRDILYRNNINGERKPPSHPTNLSSKLNGFDIKFSWDHPEGFSSSSGTYTYNLRVGTEAGKCDILSPMSDTTTGTLRLPVMGNCNHNLKWILYSLPPGDYYWSVQAVNHSFLGGEWAEEQTFTIADLTVDFLHDTVCLGMPITFTDLSIATTEIFSRHWSFGDGVESIQINPVHYYSRAGAFVTLTINDDYSIRKRVKVLANPILDIQVNFVSEKRRDY